jgi:hypothetical protein
MEVIMSTHIVHIRSDRERSDGRPPVRYRVAVETANGTAKAVSCSCPARGACKHLERAELLPAFLEARKGLLAAGKLSSPEAFATAFERAVDRFGGRSERLAVNKAIKSVIEAAQNWNCFDEAALETRCQDGRQDGPQARLEAALRRGARKAAEKQAKGGEACCRCGGDGHIPHYSHVEGGLCFRCWGCGVELGNDVYKTLDRQARAQDIVAGRYSFE